MWRCIATRHVTIWHPIIGADAPPQKTEPKICDDWTVQPLDRQKSHCNFSSRDGYRESGQTNRAPQRRTHLCTRDGGANTPCLGGQLKYLTPPTEPSFLPLGLSSLTPNHKPEQTKRRSKDKTKQLRWCFKTENT